MSAISVFDIFKIGIGPSSSHTGGPMKAAFAFARGLAGVADSVASVEVTLHGSLAYTGKGHGTDSAVVLGLSGQEPETIDPDEVDGLLRGVQEKKVLELEGGRSFSFDPASDIRFDYKEELPRHTNGMRFVARSAGGETLADEIYYSLGGGFIARGDEPEASACEGEPEFVFESAAELLSVAAENGLSIADLVHRNECRWRSAAEVDRQLDAIWQAMESCIERGLQTDGVLPGKMAVLRRAAKVHRRLLARGERSGLDAMEWVNAYAIAVNEENAAGGRVVTAPTNGAAGGGCATLARISSSGTMTSISGSSE